MIIELQFLKEVFQVIGILVLGGSHIMCGNECFSSALKVARRLSSNREEVKAASKLKDIFGGYLRLDTPGCCCTFLLLWRNIDPFLQSTIREVMNQTLLLIASY